jgi:uncharacterized SAM-binding protein YcdF (DUF218 family)
MDFVFAKLISTFLNPLHLLGIGYLVAVIFWRRDFAQPLALILTVAMLSFFIIPWGDLAMRWHENKVMPLPINESPAGILVLSGAEEESITDDRQQLALNGAGERLIAFVALAKKYPKAKLVFSGGSGAIAPTANLRQSDITQMFFKDIGFDDGKVLYETQSRNTHENAKLSYEMIKPQKEGVWLLVTSASHMARASFEFEMAGWRVVPYPVDYQTGRIDVMASPPDIIGQMTLLHSVIRETIGLCVARLRKSYPGVVL